MAEEQFKLGSSRSPLTSLTATSSWLALLFVASFCSPSAKGSFVLQVEVTFILKFVLALIVTAVEEG